MGCSMVYNAEITPARLKELAAEESFDAVILAAGASPVRPLIDGIDSPKVIRAEDILTGKKPQGDSIVIIGGGQVGCEVAELLAAGGRKITIIEMLDKMLPAMLCRLRHYKLYKLALKGVVMQTSTNCDKVEEDGIWVTRLKRKYKIPADSIVLATGYRSNKELESSVRSEFSNVHAHR